MNPQIVLEHISKSYKMPYGTITPLKDISISIDRGERVAIMGPSGSGKTTLLSLLGCLERPTEGKYTFNGRSIEGYSENERSHLRGNELAFIFQDFQLIQEMTVLENVLMPFKYKDRVENKETKALMALEKVQLSHRLNHYPHQISGGEMQRAAFARAIASKPSLILADEPTGNLDSKNAESILNLLLNEKDESTVVFVTHDEEIAHRFPRIIRLKEGKLSTDEKF